MKLNNTASPILVSSLDGTSLALAAQETTPRQSPGSEGLECL